MALSEIRKQYLNAYREANKERLKEYNRKNYLKRKKANSDENKAIESRTILIRLESNKKTRLRNMNEQRLKRRNLNHKAIYRELEKIS